jgi:hypothetical protein
MTRAQIRWAVNSWSSVTQKRVSARKVRAYAREHGWPTLETELRYWLRMARAPKPI